MVAARNGAVAVVLIVQALIAIVTKTIIIIGIRMAAPNRVDGLGGIGLGKGDRVAALILRNRSVFLVSPAHEMLIVISGLVVLHCERTRVIADRLAILRRCTGAAIGIVGQSVIDGGLGNLDRVVHRAIEPLCKGIIEGIPILAERITEVDCNNCLTSILGIDCYLQAVSFIPRVALPFADFNTFYIHDVRIA